MKTRELEALLVQHGWYETKRKGTNHRKWRKPGENKPIIISGNASRESDKGQEEDVLTRLGLK